MTYVGFTTKEPRIRAEEHNQGLTKTTKSNIPWRIETIVSFHDKERAKAFEKYLKAGSGYAFAKRHFWSSNSADIPKAENPWPTKLAK